MNPNLLQVISSFSIFIFVFLSLDVNSQTHCEVKSDPFTKEKIIRYEYELSFIYFKKDSSVTIDMFFTYGGQIRDKMPKGSKVLIKLANDEIVEFSTTHETDPVTKSTGGSQYAPAQIYTSFLLRLYPTKEQIEKLSMSPAVIVRYPDLIGGFKDRECKGQYRDYGKRLRSGAECILSN